MHQTSYEPSPNSGPEETKQPDGKVVWLMPRRRPAAEQAPKPPPHDDEDPGPSAA